MIRLNKRMAELGMCSRREADAWIAEGWVTVDGKVAAIGQLVGIQAKIEIHRAARDVKQRQITILLNKPVGYVSGQPEDGYQSAEVLIRPGTHWEGDTSGIRFTPAHARHLAVAGRLDIDSTGLLLLTQDGTIARRIIGEDSDIEKEYLVRVQIRGDEGSVPRDRLPAAALKKLQHGLKLDGKPLQPAVVEWINPEQLRFVLREGKKRQIRRMCEQVGLAVTGLKRVRIGDIKLGKLPLGQWQYLARWRGDMAKTTTRA